MLFPNILFSLVKMFQVLYADGFSLSATAALLLQFVLDVNVRHTCYQGRDK